MQNTKKRSRFKIVLDAIVLVCLIAFVIAVFSDLASNQRKPLSEKEQQNMTTAIILMAG